MPAQPSITTLQGVSAEVGAFPADNVWSGTVVTTVAHGMAVSAYTAGAPISAVPITIANSNLISRLIMPWELDR